MLVATRKTPSDKTILKTLKKIPNGDFFYARFFVFFLDFALAITFFGECGAVSRVMSGGFKINFSFLFPFFFFFAVFFFVVDVEDFFTEVLTVFVFVGATVAALAIEENGAKMSDASMNIEMKNLLVINNFNHENHSLCLTLLNSQTDSELLLACQDEDAVL